ncbi:MAG: hypothetical protein IH971_07525 [Candidatus Marinimicrobia bacterium]|nr:hypothetical protein [Candidatus Neomarinimicrobiota bacterium]
MDQQEFLDFLSSLSENTENELNERWAAWKKDFAENEVHEVIGGLLARQATLFIKMSQSPPMWNWHMGPLILRTMVDTHIAIAWILEDRLERSRKYIHFGLGQTKLEIEHRKKQLEEEGPDKEAQQFIDVLEAWLNSQRWSFLTEVNIGRWSGISTREMAEDAGITDFYNYCFMPFSAGTHSQWHHIARMNLNHCNNPLHRYHRLPAINDDHTTIEPLILAAKYVWKSMDLFDRKFDVKVEAPCTYDLLLEWLGSAEDGEVEAE